MLNHILLIIIIITALAAEYIIPYKKQWLVSKEETKLIPFIFSMIVFYFIFGFFLSKLLLGKALTIFTDIPYILALILAFMIGEFFYYWYHRTAHNNPYLWTLHILHHSPKEVNLVNLMLLHPLEIIINNLCRNLPILILGFSGSVIAGNVFIVTTISVYSHLNANIKCGYLKYLIGNPELHRYHHSTDFQEAKNYSVLFPFYDIIFGTFYLGKGGPTDVGLTRHYADIYPRQLWKRIISYPTTVFRK